MKKIFQRFRRWELNSRNSQKVDSDSEALRGRLQPSSWAERDFLRKEEAAAWARFDFYKKSEQAIQSLLRRGGVQDFKSEPKAAETSANDTVWVPFL